MISQNANFVGDVKYSILEPGIFLRENPDWALMDGANLPADSKLAQLGITTLPDARSTFLRGMNVGRNDGFADPDGDARSLLVVQHWTIGNHTHVYHYPGYHVSDRVAGGGNYPRVMLEEGGDRPVVNPGLGQETRPNNIALYIYVKIA